VLVTVVHPEPRYALNDRIPASFGRLVHAALTSREGAVVQTTTATAPAA
jgi:hypothetical protein